VFESTQLNVVSVMSCVLSILLSSMYKQGINGLSVSTTSFTAGTVYPNRDPFFEWWWNPDFDLDGSGLDPESRTRSPRLDPSIVYE
jgi:hypothetical protein